MATTDNGTTGVGAHYWTVQLTPPAQAPAALTEFVSMARNAMQLSVDLLGRGAPRLPPSVDDLLTTTTYEDLGVGETNAHYKALLAKVANRKESLLETDSSVVHAAITVSARNDSTLKYVQGLVEQLQSQMTALTGKLTSAQCAAVMQQIGYVMDILNARVTAVYEANHGTAGSSGGGGGTASGGATGSGGTSRTGAAGGSAGAATNGSTATPAGTSSNGTGSGSDMSSMLQQMQMQQMMQQATGQKAADSANGQGTGGDAGSASGQQSAAPNTGQSAQNPAAPTASGAQPAATVAQTSATNGNRLVTVTLDGQKVQLPSVVADAVNKELNNPNGCDARAAYAGTPGQASSWSQISDIGALHTGDVVQWDNRSAIVVNDTNGLRMIIDGNYVPLTQQTSQSPPQDAYGAYGNFRGFFHPAGADLTGTAEPVSQDISNPPVSAASAAT